MRNGYRAVQLLDNDFEPIEGSYILVRVQLQAELTRTELAAERIMGYDELKRIQKLEEDRMQYRIAEPDKKAYKMEKPPK
jgi:DNA-binding sugar fermentation-stimulating protein